MVAIHRQRRTTRRSAATGGSSVRSAAEGSCDVALTLALRLNAFPSHANQIRRNPVPPGMLVVIRIASGCAETRAAAAAATGLDESLVTSAAVLLVSLYLGDSRGDPRRILCLGVDTPLEVARSHMKWLLKWLHPDRNSQAAVSSMAGRVIDAWGKVKSSAALPPPALAGSPPQGTGKKLQKRPRSRWRAVALSVRRAELEETRIQAARRDVARELSELHDHDRQPSDDN